ncbi:MAG: hypothetical protein HY722_03995 [Planctomycetes bacterium]|nr:hypothetical protein [Planctomycetota bacterium]
MKTGHFSPDIEEFLQRLAGHEVRYLVVGGEAVIYYGHVRLTGDVDLYYECSVENVRRLYAALRDFWRGEVPGVATPDELLGPDLIVQFGRPPNRIDLLGAIDGVTFTEAWPRRRTETLALGGHSVPLHYLGLDDLIRNKERVGRPRDLEDLAYLRAARERGNPTGS